MASHSLQVSPRSSRTACRPLSLTLMCAQSHSDGTTLTLTSLPVSQSPMPQCSKNCLNLTPSCLGRCENVQDFPSTPTQIGQVPTDHMLYMDYSPDHGWSPPQIKPYGPLNLDPASSCFHYCPNVFEGLKVRGFLLAHRQSICQHPDRHTWDPMGPHVYSAPS
jgi:hypothetical protein